jgi:hypothetical protein
MQRQYDFITTQAKAGYTILAYDRRIPKCRVRKITARNLNRVSMVCDVLHIDGENAKGWTVCRKN